MSAIHTLGIDQGVAPEPLEFEKPPRNGRVATAYELHMHNDPTILFEEYLHFAKLTRVEEREAEQAIPKEKRTILGTITNRFKTNKPVPVTGSGIGGQGVGGGFGADEKGGDTNVESDVPFDAFNNLTYGHPSEVSDAEWKALSRGVRTVGWSTCFYLITSDIIGPFGIP